VGCGGLSPIVFIQESEWVSVPYASVALVANNRVVSSSIITLVDQVNPLHPTPVVFSFVVVL
jgi:hypothetical protein